MNENERKKEGRKRLEGRGVRESEEEWMKDEKEGRKEKQTQSDCINGTIISTVRV